MIRNASELLPIYGSPYGIAKAVRKGKLFKVGHGLYCDDGPELSELEIVCARYPRAVLTMESAYAHHGLSDYVPERYSFATPLNSHWIQSPKVSQSFMENVIVDIGIEEVKTKYGVVRIYDKERMLIELLRLKSKFPPDYFREIANSYRDLAKRDGIDFRKLSSYCLQFKKGNLIQKRIEEVIL